MIYLHVVTPVVIATLTEKSVRNYVVDVEFIQYGIRILSVEIIECLKMKQLGKPTLLRLAVNTTIS
jgi:hypothetical protein